ncbi:MULTISPECIES: BrnT family toxin [unclassified Snodgrassella]|uniref:BrnT family toxin n=1 Tax=unclassified Snodgrassella TaxID=2625236 RepID=UPI0018DD786E|nr:MULTISPECIES: BrnT family toxin [unclassified Snodgrassella]MBI0068863.1 BrnT family toxin [Snodgrassella sp. M0110]MBI0077400.1 BrnT family toxin [Snodgrassella sp. M0118]MBI0079797.1 BrnT family toxin [Snodgrassella sp. M0112]
MINGFEWSQEKAASNIKKHGVSFDEAVTVFWDENALIINDPDHSEDEDRFILLGMSENLRVLVVIHCERGNTIRLISARTATKQERKQYEAHL